MKFFCCLLGLLLIPLVSCLQAREILLKYGSNWHYHNGEGKFDPTWKDPDFDEEKWENGAAPFMYGHYRGNTIVRHNQRPRPITTFYRTSFNLDDPDDVEYIAYSVRADDGHVLYINGHPCANVFMPTLPEYTPEMLATDYISKYRPATVGRIPAKFKQALKKGRNTLAIEVHQIRANSSDLLMDLELSYTKKGTREKQIFDEGSEWAYFDQRNLPDSEWTSPKYDDSSWKRGPGGFGYANSDIKTTTDEGNDSSNRPPATWFRKTFEIDETLNIQALNLKYMLDDGAVFYLNGHEVHRENMPAGFVDHHSYAPLTVKENYETFRLHRNIPADHLVAGQNVIAVSVHQNRPESTDLSFDLSLGIEYLPGEPRRVPVKIVASSKTVDITDAESLKKSEAGDWLATSKDYIEKAVGYHAKGKLQPAVHAYYASKWAEVFSRYNKILKPALKNYLLDAKRVSVSQEFFDLHSPKDDHDEVYRIIGDLHSKQTEAFMAFPKLAMAIAIVYDQEPPTNWPHHQVPGHILSRKLPDLQEAMKFWVETDRSGKSLQDLKDLSIEELKFVVDTPASFEELKEAQGLRVRLSSMDGLYSGIEYDHGRLETNTYNWPHQSYLLPRIKEKGGICVDQAYYTVQVAKAHGVPAMMVSGAGNNGNHAWVGFLNNRERWDFTVGRYEESKFVTGITFDPQTWEQPTDHQLAMMSERFRTNPKFRISRVHTIFSGEYLKRKKIEEAIKSAEAAIDVEDRNYSAWEALIAAKNTAKTPSKEMDEIFENGSKAFSRYADLEAQFLRLLSNSYEAQDRTAEAAKLRARIISRNRRDRPDLALEEARSSLEESMTNEELEEQVALYKKQISRLKDAGLIAYYALANPFLEHLLGEDRKDLAKTALEYTERRMDVEEGSQLEAALLKWQRRVED
ncbi:MAG: hypothetical protein ACJA16_002861 [Akkermansiaceae bacterium]|jgi:hypothetical protein